MKLNGVGYTLGEPEYPDGSYCTSCRIWQAVPMICFSWWKVNNAPMN